MLCQTIGKSQRKVLCLIIYAALTNSKLIVHTVALPTSSHVHISLIPAMPPATRTQSPRENITLASRVQCVAESKARRATYCDIC